MSYYSESDRKYALEVIARLQDENDKLRELVRDVFTIHWHGLDCTECPKRFHDRCTHLGGCEWLGILSDRMRELGVEV